MYMRILEAQYLTSHRPRNYCYQAGLGSVDAVVVYELLVCQDDRHDASIISVEAGRKDHAIQQQRCKAKLKMSQVALRETSIKRMAKASYRSSLGKTFSTKFILRRTISRNPEFEDETHYGFS